MMEARKEIVNTAEYSRWSVDIHSGMFMCPCGKKVEDDGSCTNGHVSPFRQEKMI